MLISAVVFSTLATPPDLSSMLGQFQGYLGPVHNSTWQMKRRPHASSRYGLTTKAAIALQVELAHDHFSELPPRSRHAARAFKMCSISPKGDFY